MLLLFVSALAVAVGVSPFAAAAKPLPRHKGTVHGKRHHKRTVKRSHRRRRRTHRPVRHGYSIRKSNAADSKRVCVYSAHSIAILQQFDSLVGRNVACVMVYNDTSPDWSNWEQPWFLRHTYDDNNWRAWATAPGTDRQLVISQNLFPASENNSDWRDAGARGDYEQHAVALARNLVAAGLGNSIIRLAHEANGDWYPDSIGNTQSDFDRWRQFWRNTVIAMRSVPGANFTFDWCINAAYRPIPLASFYPGDDVVDIVGIDAYDSGVAAGLPRWSTIYNRTDGIGDVVAFARAHGKPLSIPEWGVAPLTSPGTGGDDGAYVDGIASVVRNNPVAYQSYFFKYGFATQLSGGPDSLSSYRRHFGAGGDSVGGPAAPRQSTPPPAPAPAAPPAAGSPPSRSKPKRSAPVRKRHSARRHTRRHQTSHRSRRRRAHRR